MRLKNITEFWKETERTIGGLKFAIILILLFILSLVAGTLVESYFGTEYANRLIYKSWPFMLLQFFLFLSIFYATLLRLPPKKRLYGFYIIHAGLILVFCGSFITYQAGVDGTITLLPNTPTRELTLNRDIVSISDESSEKLVTYFLPYSPGPSDIDQSWGNIHLETFYPFSENRLQWAPFLSEKSHHSSQYFLSNDQVSQAFTLSLHPESTEDFPASLTMGPLSIHYLPAELSPCFGKNSPSKLILWNADKQSCFTPEEKKISIQKTHKGNRFLVVDQATLASKESRYLTFFPEISPWPIDMNFQFIENSPVRIFSTDLFEKSPHLFLFGRSLSYFDKGEKSWVIKEIHKGTEGSVALPWMGFKLTLTDHFDRERPLLIPEYQTPIHENGQTIRGEQKAIKVRVKDQSYWVRQGRPLNLQVEGRKVTLELKKETMTLPYEFNLDSFKMDMDPGTSSPASYESFVTLFHSTGFDKHHIFMNNPLDYDGYTFYQASYFPTEEGHGSVLSVNYDPGRPVKYLGSLFLVLGAIIHWQLNKKRYLRKNAVKLSQELT